MGYNLVKIERAKVYRPVRMSKGKCVSVGLVVGGIVVDVGCNRCLLLSGRPGQTEATPLKDV